jgi:hypothetical protein
MFFKVEVNDNIQIKTDDDVSSAQFYNIKDVNIEDIGLNSIKKAIQKIKNTTI